MPLIKPPTPSSTPQASSSTTKQVPPFAACPRPNFVEGKEDWLQITSPKHFTNFDICPDCYNTSFKPTAYAQFISPAPPRPQVVSTRCDFSDLWIRIAWAWLFSQGAPDLSLLGQVAEIQDSEGACPNLAQISSGESSRDGDNEKPSTTRTWYCLLNPQTGSLIEDLTVCSDCISHIYTICPCLRGIFAAAAGGQPCLATCDLMISGEARTLMYMDQIIDVAETTISTGTRDVEPLTSFVRKWAAIPTCGKFKRVQGQKCYSIPTQVPEWTICEECYITHVEPLSTSTSSPSSASSPSPILPQISASPYPPPSGFTCQLYSARLQQYFADALSTSDLGGLRTKILARDRKLQETKQELERLKLALAQQRMQMKAHQDMALIAQQSAFSSSLAWQMGGGYKPVSWFQVMVNGDVGIWWSGWMKWADVT